MRGRPWVGLVPTARESDAAMIHVLQAVVADHGRWGFWKCYDRLRLDGHSCNHKRADTSTSGPSEGSFALVTPCVSASQSSTTAFVREYAQALIIARDFVAQAPVRPSGYALLAMIHAEMGGLEEAHAEAAQVLRLDSAFTVSRTASLALPDLPKSNGFAETSKPES